MAKVSDEKFALWVSRGLRWSLGIGALFIAWHYEDAQMMYVVGALLIVTGFLKPKRCVDGQCEVPKNHSST
jgi:hypothetical protein